MSREYVHNYKACIADNLDSEWILLKDSSNL